MIEFEVIPVVTSPEAVATLAPPAVIGLSTS